MLDLKIEDALLRIKKLNDETKGDYILSFSGGKDSTIVLYLWLMAKERYSLKDISILFADTKVEYDATYEFVEMINNNFHCVEYLQPKMSFVEVMKKYGKPFASKMKSQFLSTYQNSNSYQYYYLKNILNDKPVVIDGRLIYPSTPLEEKEWLNKVLTHYEKINKYLKEYDLTNGTFHKPLEFPEYQPKLEKKELLNKTHEKKCLAELITGYYAKKLNDRYFANIKFDNLTRMEKEWIKNPEYEDYTQENDLKMYNNHSSYRTCNAISGNVPNHSKEYGITLETNEKSKERLANKHFQALHPDFPFKISSECCKKMKKEPFYDYYIKNDIKGYITGMRPQAEGGARAMQYDGCTSTIEIKGRKIIHRMPIFDWTVTDCQEFISKYNVKISRAYTEYRLERTGCIGCPFAKNLDQSLYAMYKYEPKKYKWVMATLGEVYRSMLIELPFDEEYMSVYRKEEQMYLEMRYQMLEMFRPDISNKHKEVQLKLF